LPSVQSVWLNEIGKIKNIEGNWLIWTGTVTDKAIRILEIWGQPATAEEIVNAINEGHDVKATRNRLFEDQRLMRVDMNRIGLRSWGLEEYSSIAEQMDQELERRGGCADLNDLIETLIERFNIRENSIRFFVNAPMFILEGNTLRRRTDADPYDPIAPVTETAGCYLLGADSLSWRVDITADTLRGSGRAIPAPIAAWLGVMPGGRRAFSVGGRLVAVSWPETSAAGPAIGSKRRTEDMLVYLALARFRGRPALSVLPRALQLDIRAFFGAYTKACSQADELLFQAGKAEIIDAACKRSPIGKLLPDALYVHRESLDYLEPVLRVYEGCGRAYIGGVEGANLIKIHRYSGKVSYLVYPDFEKDPHPALTRSVKLDMRARQLYCQDFGQGGNPPVLHRKETFLQKDHPLFEKFEKLTKQEERAGLLDETATIGTKDGWAARLAEKGFTLRGHRLVRAPQPPRSSDAAEKS
jgi:hypothetical protein